MYVYSQSRASSILSFILSIWYIFIHAMSLCYLKLEYSHNVCDMDITFPQVTVHLEILAKLYFCTLAYFQQLL